MTPERHSELQEIFEAAVDLPEPGRSAYLDQACAGDPDLRDQLNRLLTADEETVGMPGPIPAPARARSGVMECPKCRRCYESPLWACPRDGAILQVAFAGRQLIDGKYLVERCLGRGGMGAVYLAQHVGLEKRFALKLILQEGMLSPVYRESFENEARALGRLNHRHIVDVTDYGVDSRDGGIPYLVMECLAGKPLHQILKERHQLSFEDAMPLLRAAADAVDAAHANHIVHGDLKPSNLFLADEPDRGEPCLKVLDFGLARLTNTASGSEQPQDGHHSWNYDVGGFTPAYAAPELLRNQPATPATDRWAFGVLIYELLTGCLPFGKTLAQVAAHIQEPPPAPSSCNHLLPADIDAPLLAFLNPSPDGRPASAQNGIGAIAKAWLGSEQRKWQSREWPRRLVLAALSAALAVSIAVGVMQLPLARDMEGWIADQRFALVPRTAPDPRVALISIDDAMLDADSRPLTDRAPEFAAMIDRIFSSGARALAIDMLLPSRWSESQQFEKAVASHADRLVLALFASPSGAVVGTECLNNLTGFELGPQKYMDLFGLVNLEEDADRTIRRARLVYTDRSGRTYESFARRAVEDAFGNRRRPASNLAPVWIDYAVRLRELTPISWKDVPERLSVTSGLFRDRLVIAGASFSGSGDEHRVPGVASNGLLSGQLVQALIANTLLEDHAIREIPLLPCLAAVGVACLLTIAGAICFPQHYGIFLMASALLLCGYAAFALWMFRAHRTMVPVAGPELAILVSMLTAWWLKARLRAYPVTEP